jgi:hypothetical protein
MEQALSEVCKDIRSVFWFKEKESEIFKSSGAHPLTKNV